MRSTSTTHLEPRLLLEGHLCADSLQRSNTPLPHADERRESCCNLFTKELRQGEEIEHKKNKGEELHFPPKMWRNHAHTRLNMFDPKIIWNRHSSYNAVPVTRTDTSQDVALNSRSMVQVVEQPHPIITITF